MRNPPFATASSETRASSSLSSWVNGDGPPGCADAGPTAPMKAIPVTTIERRIPAKVSSDTMDSYLNLRDVSASGTNYE